MPTPDPLAPLLREPAGAAILTDFDGSLAPIVDDPPAARPLPRALEVLGLLVDRMALVGVVSGRPASFLRRVLPVPGLVLAGLYGMERIVDGEIVLDPLVVPFMGAAEEAALEAERALPGLYVERKGEVSCVIHWRREPERADEALSLGREIAVRHGLAARPGRMSIELRPPVDVDKGTAVESLVAGFDVALFAGDDLGDLEAFEALDRLVGSGRLRAAVKVAVRSSEAPGELLERADERVDGPDALLALFEEIAGSF